MIHRPHDLVGVGAAVISLFPHKREGAERRLALLHSLAPRRRRPRALRARRLPALHCGVFHPGTVSSGPNRRLSSPWSGRLSPPFIRTVPAFFRRQPFVLRADGNPGRPGPPVCVTQGRGRHACSAITTPH